MATNKPQNASHVDAWLVPPEDLVLIMDEEDPLYDPRVELPPDEALVRNVMRYGVKVNILAKRDGDRFIVIDGRQRVKAAIEANKRLTTEGREPLKVKVTPERGKDVDHFATMVMTNELRLDESPIGRAEKLQRYLSMGRSEEDAADAFGKPLSWVKQALALLDCAKPIQAAVENGNLSVTAAAKLAKLSRAEQMDALMEALKKGGTAREVERKVREKRTGKKIAARPSGKKQRVMLEAMVELCADGAGNSVECGIKLALQWVLDGKVAGPIAAALKQDVDAEAA